MINPSDVLKEVTDTLPKRLFEPFTESDMAEILAENSMLIESETERLFGSDVARQSGFRNPGKNRTKAEIRRDVMTGMMGELNFCHKVPGLSRISKSVVEEHCKSNPFYDRLFIKTSANALVNWQYQDRVIVKTGDIVEFKTWAEFHTRDYCGKRWQDILKRLVDRQILFCKYIIIYGIRPNGTFFLEGAYVVK